MSENEIRDLRDWLGVVEDMGELRRVCGADRDLEIGAVSELSYAHGAPSALLFDEIQGFPSGQRVLTGSVSNSRRLGATLRLGRDIDDADLVEALRGKPMEWEGRSREFSPNVVDSGPVMENVQIAPDIDLGVFPSPLWHEFDGGHYIGTGCIVFTSDPDSGAVNGGAYRIQVQDDGRSATVNAVPGKHGAHNIDAWFRREGRAPVTVSIGHDPLLLVVAGTDVPAGVSELAYAGAIAGHPIDVITSDVNGLPLPARSEITIEGWLQPEHTFPEGPFGEWTGYYSGSDHPVLAVDIRRVMYRNDPIILGAPPGKPPHDYSYMRTVVRSSMILDDLVKAGVPGVTGVWVHEAGGGRLLITVAIQQRFAGHSRQVAYLTSQGQAGAYMNRYVVVVDDDIDPRSLDEVVWAMCTRSDPARDIEVMRYTWGSKADPLVEDQLVPYNSRAVIDACRPFENAGSFPRVAVATPELKKKTAEKWSSVILGDATGVAP